MSSFSGVKLYVRTAFGRENVSLLERCPIVIHECTHVMCFHRLLEGGVDVNSRHPLGWTALHSAVINRQHRYI